ncbi:MAG TPA: EamA family transporter [Pyrinomonadaceae bacterium]|jgi:drug/metabolite transporter (DMT)-like permease|nr:EamA family transporter [Pyrinomonadaceae bacterium]
MKARLVWLILCGIWGSTWLFIKLGLADLPPITFAGIRFVISCAILFPLVLLRHLSLPKTRGEWFLLAGTGVLSFSLNYGLVFWAEQYITSGLAALLQAMLPAFGLILAHIHVPAERMTWVKIAGVVLGVCGVGVVFSNQLAISGRLALAGCVAMVLSAFFAAYSNVLLKTHGRNLNPAVIAAFQMFFGLIPLLIYGLTLEGNPLRFRWSTIAVLSLLYLAFVGSVVAFLLYYWLMQNMDVTKTMLISLVTPVVAVILGMIVLDEQLSWRTLVGGAMIIAGIGFIVVRKPRARTVTVAQ